ncbi:CAP domain-containing protein [Paenibacillus lemnae]|uniref:Serine protease n=1 Tax=Paenibacillus lemnae TaxID=1330551 RepID=A0A848M9X4_PAELE|nr:CAP domain-containing protein [Paenibacillus lemnae]NMO97001.1 serine protease [Paenibacillus lemnae]
MNKHIIKKVAAGSLAAILSVGIMLPSQASAAPSQDQLQSLQQQIQKYLESQGWSKFEWVIQQPAKQPQQYQPQPEQPNVPAANPGSSDAPSAPTPSAQQPKPEAPAAPASKEQSAYTQQVVDLVNQERAKSGLAALSVNDELAAMALDKAKDMSNNNYFDHQSPTYGSPFDMMKAYGISYSYAGENIAKGQRTPEEVMKAWMNSEGHRKNIMSPNFTMIGVGYYNGHWVQEFISQ